MEKMRMSMEGSTRMVLSYLSPIFIVIGSSITLLFDRYGSGTTGHKMRRFQSSSKANIISEPIFMEYSVLVHGCLWLYIPGVQY